MELSQVSGFEVEVCLQCKGVWLDQGELEDIIDRTIEEYISGPSRSKASHNGDRRRYFEDASYDDFDEFVYRQKQKKKNKRRPERERMF